MRLSETGIPGVWCRSYGLDARGRERKRYGWTICWRGRTIRRTSKVNSLRGAAAERSKAQERLAMGLPADEKPETGPYTVAQAVKDYLAACENLRSLVTFRGHARQLADHFGTLPVSDLSLVTIAGFRRKRAEEKVSVTTANRALSFLRAALNHAQAEGKIGEHYFSGLSRSDRRKMFPEEFPKAGLRRVSDEQFLAVLERLPEPYRPVARLLLATGMRKGEALGLRWSEIRGDALFLRRTKSGKSREVPLTPEIAALLPRRPADAADEDLVFLGREGGDLRNNFDRAWRAARLAAEEERKRNGAAPETAALAWLRVHDLRHEAASRYVEAGGTSRELMDLFGWSDLKIAARYAKSDQERIRETLRRVHLPAAECTRSARAEGAEIRAFAK